MKLFIALAMTLSFTTAMAANGTLEGSCSITQNQKTEKFDFNVSAKDQFIGSEVYSVKIPLKNTYNDDYTIVVQNTAGLTKDETWSSDKIEISVGAKRYFCNPPVLQESGVSRTPCDRPRGWVTLGGADRVVSPKGGESLRLELASEQIAFSCEATFIVL